jgi:hypothetical protein
MPADWRFLCLCSELSLDWFANLPPRFSKRVIIHAVLKIRHWTCLGTDPDLLNVVTQAKHYWAITD